MKKVISSGLAGFVFRNILRLKTSKISGRLVALFLIMVLLMPCFIFNPMAQTNAQSNLFLSESAPDSAPPQVFEETKLGT